MCYLLRVPFGQFRNHSGTIFAIPFENKGLKKKIRNKNNFSYGNTNNKYIEVVFFFCFQTTRVDLRLAPICYNTRAVDLQ